MRDSTEHAVHQNEVNLRWQSCSKQKIKPTQKKATQMAKGITKRKFSNLMLLLQILELS